MGGGVFRSGQNGYGALLPLLPADQIGRGLQKASLPFAVAKYRVEEKRIPRQEEEWYIEDRYPADKEHRVPDGPFAGSKNPDLFSPYVVVWVPGFAGGDDPLIQHDGIILQFGNCASREDKAYILTLDFRFRFHSAPEKDALPI
ncbi:hypothetical protein ES703_106434 [subsurface metagenome]